MNQQPIHLTPRTPFRSLDEFVRAYQAARVSIARTLNEGRPIGGILIDNRKQRVQLLSAEPQPDGHVAVRGAPHIAWSLEQLEAIANLHNFTVRLGSEA